MAATISHRRRLRLIRQLQDSRDVLAAWDASLRAVAVQLTNGPVATQRSGNPSEIAVLLAIVDEAKHGLEQRLGELGGPTHSAKAVKPRTRTKRSSAAVPSALDLCVKACRACGRRLGAAFQEAQAMADAASLRVLYGAIRDLEKQLWVLDPRQAY